MHTPARASPPPHLLEEKGRVKVPLEVRPGQLGTFRAPGQKHLGEDPQGVCQGLLLPRPPRPA